MKFMTVKELQDELQISRNKAYELIHSGALPVIQIGRTYRIPRDKFEDWITYEAQIKNKHHW